MQNCKDPNWNIRQATITLSARLEGTKLVLIDAKGAPLAEVDLSPAVQAVLDSRKKKPKRHKKEPVEGQSHGLRSV